MLERKRTLSSYFSRRRRIQFFFAILCPLLPSGLYSQQTSSQLVERFKKEAPEAWKVVESEENSPATVKITTKLDRILSGKTLRSEEAFFLLQRKPGFRLLESVGTKEAARIFGQNPEYSFSLSKKQQGDEWLLDKLQIRGEKNYGTLKVGEFELFNPGSYSLIKHVPSFPMMVADPRFKALRAETVEVNLIRLHIQTSIGTGLRAVAANGWLDLDPSNAWVLRRCELKIVSPVSGTMTLEGTKEFAPAGGDGYHPCESWSFVLHGPDDYVAKEEARFQTVNSSAPPNEIFTLSYYGLPEPMGVQPLPAPPRTWIWLAVGAACAATLALVFAWLKRRRASVVRSSSPAPSGRRAS